MISQRTLRNSRAIALLVAVTLAAAACGSDAQTASDTDTGAEATTPDSSEPTAPAESDSSVAAESPAGIDTTLFFDGALAEDITTEDCTLSGGTETTCFRVTVAGYPADHEVGPFCPSTTSDTADEVGIWFDGDEVYDIDGEFILDLPEIYDDDNWHLHDDDGHVHVTDTEEAFDAAARPDVDPEYQNHCVEGRIEWLDNGEPVTSTVLIPTTPVPGNTSTPDQRGNLGVTFNGVVIAPSAPVDAILGAYTIAAFDDCGGHINPFDGYHLHGARGCGESSAATEDGETAAFGYALDGYRVHSPLDDMASADLDQCNGHTTSALGYHYHASAVAENAVLVCYSGETA